MIKKLQNIIRNKYLSVLAIGALICIWALVSELGLVPRFMLPSPLDVVNAFVGDFSLLMYHLQITLKEAVIGLTLGVLIGAIFASLMDRFELIYRIFYPLVVVSQTIPTVAIAPLLVLWFGYEMTPKVILIVLVTFFPITVGLLDGFRDIDKDEILLLKSMGATEFQIFRYIKCPSALPSFFSGLKIAVAYSIVGAVISEWLGGFGGLGVYMTRVKKAFAFDKMFAVIFLISILSLVLMAVVNIIEKKATPYKNLREDE